MVMVTSSLAQKWLALSSSLGTALIAILEPNSLAAAMSGDSFIGVVMNLAIFIIALVGWADLVWNDIRGKLIWPRFDPVARHRICVFVYAALAAMFLLRSFTAASVGSVLLVVYYISVGIGIGLVAINIATEAECDRPA